MILNYLNYQQINKITMQNLVNSIELQQEKLQALKIVLSSIRTDDNNQTTSDLLKELNMKIINLIINDF